MSDRHAAAPAPLQCRSLLPIIIPVFAVSIASSFAEGPLSRPYSSDSKRRQPPLSANKKWKPLNWPKPSMPLRSIGAVRIHRNAQPSLPEPRQQTRRARCSRQPGNWSLRWRTPEWSCLRCQKRYGGCQSCGAFRYWILDMLMLR